MAHQIQIAKVKDVIEKKYFIPDFQRDYAWTGTNLKLLLDDVMSAQKEQKDSYILGSIVLSKKNDEYIVIDGQQRLTSLKIILLALGDSEKDFLEFENRDLVASLFKRIAEINEKGKTVDSIELKESDYACQKIISMYQYVLDYFNRIPTDKKNDFKYYLDNNVCFIEKTLADDANIQHSFEVLNTVGEQLKKEDIAKAKIIADIQKITHSEKVCDLFNFAWLLCYDIENDLPLNSEGKSLLSFVTEIFNAASLNSIYGFLKNFVHETGESVHVKLIDIVSKVENGGFSPRTKLGIVSDYQSGVYSVCLLPYELIDVALSAALGDSCSISDVVKRDKTLYDDNSILSLIKSLLLHRIAFDQFVVKRWKNTQDWIISANIKAYKNRIIMIESMMTVSGVDSAKKMLSIVKNAMDDATANSSEINTRNIIWGLEKYSINRAKKIENYDNGVKTDHFIFHWLDYLLYLNPPEKIKDKASGFKFTYTTSVEHFMPQHQLSGMEYTEEWQRELDTFGNLALISLSSNSRQGNSEPLSKVQIAENRPLESLKYEFMLRITSANNGWSINDCQQHGHDMKVIIEDYKEPEI